MASRLTRTLPGVRSLAIAALLFLHGLHPLWSQSPAPTPEWPRFRGPNGSGLGTAPNLPAEFSASDFNWRIELPGIGHSSPVICGDRVFVTASPKGTTERIAICASVEDGRILWTKTYDFGSDELNEDNSYAASSPAVDGEHVYFLWASPKDSALVALDQKDGREIWNVSLGPFVSEDGPGTSLIVFEDKIILSFDQDRPSSFLLALDARTGKERWRWEHEGYNNTPATPCLFFPPQGRPQIVLATLTLGVFGVDARGGNLLWRVPDIMKKRCVASPIVTESGLIVAQCGEGPEESSIEVVRPASDGQSAAKAYEVVRVGGHVPTPLALDGRLFLWKENGYVTCLRAETNEQIWSERVRGSFYGSPVCVNNRLYNISTRGDLFVVAAADQFQQIARIPLGEGSYATPAIAGGRMYLRTFSHLISVGK